MVAVDRRGQAVASKKRGRCGSTHRAAPAGAGDGPAAGGAGCASRTASDARGSGLKSLSVSYGDGARTGSARSVRRYRRGRFTLVVRATDRAGNVDPRPGQAAHPAVIARILRAAGRVVEIRDRPLLMGIVNATPDSFSDGGEHPTLEARVRRAAARAGARAPTCSTSAASRRAAAVRRSPSRRRSPAWCRSIERVAELGALVSVDTHKPAVAEAAIAAGAAIVNDVSGLRDPALADVCARTGAALVIMHTRVAPKGTLLDPAATSDVVADVRGFLPSGWTVALARGVAPEQIVLDPGPDFAKTPAQTVAVLRAARRAARARAARCCWRSRARTSSARSRAAARASAARRRSRRWRRRRRGARDPARARRRRGGRLPAPCGRCCAGSGELAPDEGLTPDRYPRRPLASLVGERSPAAAHNAARMPTDRH